MPRGVFALLLLLGACSTASEEALPPLRSEVVEAYLDTGLSENVASCVVGLGERQVELIDLDPSTPTPPETQELIDEIVLSCVEAEKLSNPDFDESPALAFSSEPDVFGDDTGLDELWLWCEAGDGAACDELWQIAPVGSTYERFGVTCGERFDLLDCSEELELAPGTTIDRTLLDPEPEPSNSSEVDEGEVDESDDVEADDTESDDTEFDDTESDDEPQFVDVFT